MNKSLLVLFAIGAVGCCSATQEHAKVATSEQDKSSVHSDTKPTSVVSTIKDIYDRVPIRKKVCLDERFSDEDSLYIAQAIVRWNHSLGGRYVLSLNKGLNHCSGWKIYLVPDDKSFQSTTERMVMGFADSIGGDNIYIIRNRIDGERKLQRVIMHEIGHLLGVEHSTDNHGLMAEYYSMREYDSIDLRTLRTVVRLHNLR